MSTRPFLPPLPRLPHDPLSWLLDGRAGWRDGTLQNLEREPSQQSLQLAIKPATLRSFGEPSGSLGGLTLPYNVALGPDGSVYLLDRETASLKRFDPCTCSFEQVPCVGGVGAEARQLRAPNGIAICAGNLYICDTGNRRVSVFSLHGFGLRAHWRPADPAIASRWQPYDIAFDSAGRAYVTDRAQALLHRFSPAGRWLTPWKGLDASGVVATDCGDRIVVVDSSTPSRATIVDAEGTKVAVETRADDLAASFPPLPFRVDAAGQIHLGSLCGPEAEIADRCAPPSLRAAERGVFDLRGMPVAAPQAEAPLQFEERGELVTTALDSQLYRCQWHRVILRGAVPDASSVEVSTFTSEVELDGGQIGALADSEWDTGQYSRGMRGGEWDCLVRSGGGRYLWLKLVFRGDGWTTPRLDSASVEFPRISLRRYLPAVFGEEPASADFTDRFLSLFDTTLRSIEGKVDGLAAYFDPLSAPSQRDAKTGTDFLTWLASWVGISLERHWPEEKSRRFLKQAGKLFDIRGTRDGLRRQLLLLLDMEPAKVCCAPGDQPKTRCQPPPLNCARPPEPECAWQPPPLILEHFQVRRWLFLGSGRLGDQAVLWGQRIVNRTQLGERTQLGHTQLKTTQDPYRDPFHHTAHQYSVFVPARLSRCDAHRRALLNLLRRESPAHTRYYLEAVEPRFRIGFQSSVGFNTVVGRLPEGVTLGETPLGRASVLTSPPHERGGPSMEIGREGRIGTTTRLN